MEMKNEDKAKEQLADELAVKKLRKSAALDRLRASVYEMREPIDLRNVIASLEGTLRDMGVKFDDYSVQIIDEEESKASHSWRAHGLYHYSDDLTTRMPTTKTAYYEAWQDKRPVYRKDLQAEDPYNEWESIWCSYEKHIRSVLDVPFSQGTVAINSVLPDAFSEADIKSLEQVAEVFSEAYTRFEDIQKLEESEAELRKHRDHLETLVEERATELKEINVELQLEVEEHERTEGELREQMNLNSIFIDQMPCATLLLRPGTREIVASNKFAAEVGAVPGKICHSELFQREDPCPWCCAPVVWETGKAQNLEVETEGVVWDVHWIPVTEDLYFHYAFDITDRKRMEEERLKTQKLESVGVLAGGIAHDFNNILTGIMGNISLAEMYMETGRSAGKVLERLREAEKSCTRAKALTQQLLTFSSGGAPIRAVASIAELLRDSATLASSGSNIRCDFSIADDQIGRAHV